MDNLTVEQPVPQILSPSSSGRGRRSSVSNSPEFEFWMVRNPSFPQPNLLSADQLFVDGVLLPLHLLPNPIPDDPPEPPSTDSNPDPHSELPSASGPEISSAPAAGITASKRWKDIFKKSDRKIIHDDDKEKDKLKKNKDRKSGGGGGAATAELNINIWPFSRSRSAGNGGSKPRISGGSAATRKVSSAPCSRSNSAGESKSRKWPSSPSRGGVHLGRSSPVWQIRRAGSAGRTSEQVDRRSKPVGTSGRVLNLNVPMCIGYRQHLSCRSGVGTAAAGGVAAECGGSGDGGRGGNLFNLRSLFTKKVY